MTPSRDDVWPELPLDEWQDTYATLHLWTQVVGKIRLACAPMVNHWWQVPLYVSTRGLTTSPIPYENRTFQIDFDFLDHRLCVETNEGARRSFALRPMSVAEFYRKTMKMLDRVGIDVSIWPVPVEIEAAIPFEEDTIHSSYDPEYVRRFFRILVQAERVLTRFRGGFIGKVSPVHFFWGAFDLAVSRFSGRRAPLHPGGMPGVGDHVMHEAYSHEVCSCGFWPGGGAVDGPAFYSYVYPEPEGYNTHPVQPESAYYHETLREFILPYDAVRTSGDPDEVLLSFLQSTYEAAADTGRWDRSALEWQPAG